MNELPELPLRSKTNKLLISWILLRISLMRLLQVHGAEIGEEQFEIVATE